MQGQVVTGKKMAELSGRDLASGDNKEDPATNFRSLSEILKWRAQSSPEHVLFSQIGSKVSTGNKYVGFVKLMHFLILCYINRKPRRCLMI